MEPQHNLNELSQFCRITEADLITLKNLKNILVKSQCYHEAALLRDLEKRMLEIIDLGKRYGFPSRRQLERWEKEENTQEKIFTKNDVTNIVELTNQPLRDALKRYEESLKTLIDHNLTGLITQLHHKDTEHEKDAESLITYMMSNFSQCMDHVNNELAYRKVGEPTSIYRPHDVLLDYRKYKVAQKVRQTLTTMEIHKPLTDNKPLIDTDDDPLHPDWIPIGDVGYMQPKCEHQGCGETRGRDYKRTPTGSSMDTEPIFLCDSHNAGFEPFST